MVATAFGILERRWFGMTLPKRAHNGVRRRPAPDRTRAFQDGHPQKLGLAAGHDADIDVIPEG